jgi:aspartate/glutamate/glutamine transport system permease protein
VIDAFSWFKWEALINDWKVFGEGLMMTLVVSALALSLALLLGVFFGVISISNFKLLSMLARVYVELFQNTPLVVQVFFYYHGLPHLGINLSVFMVGVLGVGVYHGAYISEVIRAGIQAIHKGQLEAAYSQGFNFAKAMRYIILPQAKIIILPPLANQAVSLVKNTSVLAIVAGGDLMYRADSWASSNLYYGPAYIATGFLYLMICLPLARLVHNLEMKSEVIR